MKKFILLIIAFFSLTSTALSIQWFELGGLDTGDTSYIDFDSINYSGDNVNFTTKFDLKDPKSPLRQDGINSVITKVTIYCKTKEISLNFSAYYDENNNPLEAFDHEPNKTPITTDTVGDVSYRLLCDK